MKTRNFLRTLLFLVMLAIAAPHVSAKPTSIDPIESREEHTNRLKNRLEEIKTMDVKKLSREEKKALRGEVRAIKKELKEISGGVYLSVGAILLIVLLILLLA